MTHLFRTTGGKLYTLVTLLHQRRLLRLMQELERILGGEAGRDPTLRDHYVARLVDVFDLVALASRVSHV